MKAIMPSWSIYFFMFSDYLLTIIFLKNIMNILSESPGENNSYYNDELRYKLYPFFIFVFGSNLAGRHGKGAAKQAVMEYGAIYNIGSGLAGNSYAIPTKDHDVRTIRLDQIDFYIKEFIKFTQETNYDFFVTAVGTGLAGYEHSDIAPLFKGVRNCWLPSSWKDFLSDKDKEVVLDIDKDELYEEI